MCLPELTKRNAKALLQFCYVHTDKMTRSEINNTILSLPVTVPLKTLKMLLDNSTARHLDPSFLTVLIKHLQLLVEELINYGPC